MVDSQRDMANQTSRSRVHAAFGWCFFILGVLLSLGIVSTIRMRVGTPARIAAATVSFVFFIVGTFLIVTHKKKRPPRTTLPLHDPLDPQPSTRAIYQECSSVPQTPGQTPRGDRRVVTLVDDLPPPYESVVGPETLKRNSCTVCNMRTNSYVIDV